MAHKNGCGGNLRRPKVLPEFQYSTWRHCGNMCTKSEQIAAQSLDAERGALLSYLHFSFELIFGERDSNSCLVVGADADDAE